MMYHVPYSALNWRLVIVVGVAASLVGLLWLLINMVQRYLGLGRGSAWLLGIATIGCATALGIHREMHMLRGVSPEQTFVYTFFPSLFALFGLPLGVKIYRAWIGACASEVEKAPGVAGIRAWLSPANVILAVLASVCAAYGFGYSFPSVFALTLLLLLAYPIINSMMENSTPARPAANPQNQESLTTERERVLSMLDSGRITAEESAELLNALAATVQPQGGLQSDGRSRPGGMSPRQRMILIGAGLVLIGFFLPWFSVNPGKELEHMSNQLGNNITGMAQQFGAPAGMIPPFGQTGGNFSFSFKTPTINIAGGDVEHGLGWLVLVFSAVAAILSCVETSLEPRASRTINLLALSSGVVILLYLLAGNLRLLNAGIILAAAGYLIEFAAVIRNTPGFRLQREAIM